MKKVLLSIILSCAVAVASADAKKPVASVKAVATKSAVAGKAVPAAEVSCAAPATGVLAVDWAAISKAQVEFGDMSYDAVRRAYDDFKKMPGYDVAKYEKVMAEFEANRLNSFNGLVAGDPGALRGVQRVLELKREILLSNPLLNSDKIIVGRYKIGEKAPHAMAPALGTQPNNWSNQLSADRSGFNAEIVELSGIRSKNIKSRTIYKPTNGSAVADMLLHWNGDKLLFTAVDEKGKWEVFEINRDGSGLRSAPETRLCRSNPATPSP